MGCGPDDKLFACQSPGLCYRDVVLAQMHAVRPGQKRDVQPVVDQQGYIIPVAQCFQPAGFFQHVLPHAVLFPVLYQGHTGLQRFCHRVKQVAARRQTIFISY